jgi:2'-5' RNA ligase
MRAFIGIGLPPECRRAIREAISPFHARRLAVSWTPEQNLHVTLKFLGETPPGRVDEIASLLLAAGSGIPAFEFLVEGAGGFPSLRAPRVLWVGIREPLELVGKLQENMEKVLSGAGFPCEERPFHPHITVGRVRDRLPPGWGEKYASALSGKPFGVVGVRSYQLYESRLSPGGAVYTVLRDIPLPRGPERTEREEKGK